MSRRPRAPVPRARSGIVDIALDYTAGCRGSRKIPAMVGRAAATVNRVRCVRCRVTGSRSSRRAASQRNRRRSSSDGSHALPQKPSRAAIPLAGTDWWRALHRSVDGSVGRSLLALRTLARDPCAHVRRCRARPPRRSAGWRACTRVRSTRASRAASAASFESDGHIWLGVPSNSRPQPAANSVSPQNSNGSAPDVTNTRHDPPCVREYPGSRARDPRPAHRCGRLRRVRAYAAESSRAQARTPARRIARRARPRRRHGRRGDASRGWRTARTPLSSSQASTGAASPGSTTAAMRPLRTAQM